MGYPNIEILTMWYNEEFLAPFFLSHYSFADHIRVLNDVEATDNAYKVIKRYPNATVEDMFFPDGFDNDIAVDKLNRCYVESKADWVIAVDADEFVLTPNLHEYLKERTEDVFLVNLNEVYRHEGESDLDVSIPIMEQRRYGISGTMSGKHWGIKPIVVHTGRKIKWMAGQHMIWNRNKLVTAGEILLGSHWMLADPSRPFIERRLRGRIRQSKNNVLRGHSHHCNDVTEDKVIRQLEQHMNDGRVF